MMWYGHGMTGFGWTLMSVGTLLFWAFLVGAVVLLVRALGRHRETGGAGDTPHAERLLAERFARGEIDEDEYTRRLAVLREAPDPHARGSGR